MLIARLRESGVQQVYLRSCFRRYAIQRTRI